MPSLYYDLKRSIADFCFEKQGAGDEGDANFSPIDFPNFVWLDFGDSSYSGHAGSLESVPEALPYAARWIATAGAWGTAADWTVTDPGEAAHSVPSADDAVTIANNGSTGYTITYSSTGAIWSLNTGTAATLNLQSGSLEITHGGTVSGTLDVDSQATLAAASGYKLVVTGNGVYEGALIGRGVIDFVGGEETLDTNKLMVSTLELGVSSAGVGATVTLEANLSYSGDLLIDPAIAGDGPTLNLNGKTLSLRGGARLVGEIAGVGTVNVLGAVTLGYTGGATYAMYAGRGVKVVEFGGATITQDGDALVDLDDELGGSLYIDANATYNIVTGSQRGGAFLCGVGSVIDNSGTMTISNATQFYVNANFTNRKGATLAIGAGSYIDLTGGADVLNGVISGAGWLVVGAAHVYLATSDLEMATLLVDYSNATITMDTNLNYGGETIFEPDNELDLNGKTLTLSGFKNQLDCVVQHGTVDVTGALYLFGGAFGNSNGGVFLEDNGAITQSGNSELVGELTISSGRRYIIAGAGNLGGANSVILNSGDFIDTSSTGVSHVLGNFANDGEIIAKSGSLIFNNEILGVGVELVENSAYLQIDAPSQASQKVVFSSNASAELGLKDAGQFESDIYGFGATSSEAVDLIGFNSSATKSFASVSGGLIVNISDGSHNASLHLVGSYAESGFALNAGSNGELLTYSAPG